MIIQVIFSFLAGILTIAAPCILPVLPIMLGSSIGQTSKKRPIFIVVGFILSFAVVALLFSLIIQALHLNPNVLRNIAVIALAFFAIFMIWPKPFELLMVRFSGLINNAGQIGRMPGDLGGLLLGMVLGIVWTPCAGPILATILALISTQGANGKSLILLVAYALGAGIPMLVIAYGSQYLTTKVKSISKYSALLQQFFGVLVLCLAVAMFFQVDVKIEAKLTAFFPQSEIENKLIKHGNPISINPTNSATSTILVSGQKINAEDNSKIVLEDFGTAPEFSDITGWLNSKPLKMSELRGKVILIDFWTYSCINCIRTLPFVTNWYDKYKDNGLLVIGVHTPEFAFEKDSQNVKTAIDRFKINYPVAQDNNYGTWSAYKNQYWPAEYVIDQNGKIVHEHFGEGEYDVTENLIRQLLGLDKDLGAKTSTLGKIGSPEMYFEPSRLEFLTSAQKPSFEPATYTLPSSLYINSFALDGVWKFTEDHAELTEPHGKIRLNFNSGKLFMVAASDHPITITITVDGKKQPDQVIQASQLYEIFDSTEYNRHTVDIEIPEAGFQAFTFTFG